ncbi:4'-phosphopantetheinyl transferase superfamily protein [Thalassomonas sp. RHCl1]|uniref:4'-phosphopantetheinyl transferase family protein n=1 Tax=Thalassomonas sp. RHCl1 TaxID=2995320 RepID=UPI00248B4F70|nr:4'-phosphopantetheinyl transferase superfamily protein [Thalassomonas sp. RHCl1]
MLDIWHITLDQDPGSLPQVLDKYERARAAACQLDHHRRQFMVSHIATRLILASYCATDAAELVFEHNAYGKPFLADHKPLLFSLSHTDEMALCAVSNGEALGVDIEKIRPIAGTEMAERFFSPTEHQLFSRLPPGQQQAAFFSCWTRKEAYIKAKGFGLALPLERFSVTVSPDLPAALLNSDFSAEDAARFRLMDIEVACGYKAALAYAGPPPEKVKQYHWRPGGGNSFNTA